MPVAVPEQFSDSGKADVAGRWWKAFDDPTLNRLMETAIRDNFSLAAAWHRLDQAKAVVERQSSNLYPGVNLEARGERREDQQADSVFLGLAASYEVDLWGRIDSAVEAEKYRARATLHDYQAAVLTLSAEVARSWFALAAAREELELLEQQLQTNRNILESVEKRFARGYVSSVDMLRQRQQVEATSERLTVVRSQITLATHLLAILSGRPPKASLELPPTPLPEPPALPDTGLPVELVERRPDVKRAFNLLQAADREVAAAIAERYPRLTLTASLSSSAGSADDLFADWLLAIGGNLLAPLLDGSRRAAEVSRFESRRDELLANYGQATLTAFREVEDALARETDQRRRLESIREQLRLAGKASRRLLQLYLNGVSEYIDVLTARISEQQLQRNLLIERRRLLDIRISLYRALAGGFMPEHLLTPENTSSDKESGTAPES